jgi:hypothetical protein
MPNQANSSCDYCESVFTITRSQIMQVSPANFLLVCAVAAFGVAASLVLAFATATLSDSALASVEKLAFALN